MSGFITPTPLPPDVLLERRGGLMERPLLILAPQDTVSLLKRWPVAKKTFFTHNLAELIELISGEREPLVLLDPRMIVEGELDTARVLRDMPARPVVAVLAGAEKLHEALPLASQLGLGVVLPEDCFHSSTDLNQLAEWIASNGPPIGLASHLFPGTEIHRRLVAQRHNKAEIIEEILNFARKRRADTKFLFELRLILEETINNAVFHAFHDAQGNEKYNIETFENLAPDERVEIEFAADARTIAMAVTDNQGSLRRETILGKIQRQCSSEGLLDQNGRGLHLVYSLAGRCMFHLAKRRMTQVVTLFPIDHDSWPHAGLQRPLLIFSKA